MNINSRKIYINFAQYVHITTVVYFLTVKLKLQTGYNHYMIPRNLPHIIGPKYCNIGASLSGYALKKSDY